MILPTKHITEERSLIGQGAVILTLLAEREHTVSSLWDEFLEITNEYTEVTFDWFILALDFLYSIQAIELKNGLLQKRFK